LSAKHAAAVAWALAATALAAGAAPAADSIGKWQAGTNYLVLVEPRPPQLPRGKVEVNEVFWYGCGHCYALDPTLESWKAKKPGYVEFVRTHVVWGPLHRQHARLYYTLQELGRMDLHTKVFDTIHKEGRILAARNENDARMQQKTFLIENGVSEQDFDRAYDSPAVAAAVARAEQLTVDFKVESVPILFVNGRYSTSVSQAGDETKLVSLLDDLAKSERRR
jgi:thiol:disulfide interchange protein DsbA